MNKTLAASWFALTSLLALTSQAQPDFLDGADRPQPVFERVGRDNVGIVLGRGVEIVVISGDPRLLELSGGLVG